MVGKSTWTGRIFLMFETTIEQDLASYLSLGITKTTKDLPNITGCVDVRRRGRMSPIWCPENAKSLGI